jgi:hypothetical protein
MKGELRRKKKIQGGKQGAVRDEDSQRNGYRPKQWTEAKITPSAFLGDLPSSLLNS